MCDLFHDYDGTLDFHFVIWLCPPPFNKSFIYTCEYCEVCIWKIQISK